MTTTTTTTTARRTAKNHDICSSHSSGCKMKNATKRRTLSFLQLHAARKCTSVQKLSHAPLCLFFRAFADAHTSSSLSIIRCAVPLWIFLRIRSDSDVTYFFLRASPCGAQKRARCGYRSCKTSSISLEMSKSLKLLTMTPTLSKTSQPLVAPPGAPTVGVWVEERYCGLTTWLVTLIGNFPCAYFCPCDRRTVWLAGGKKVSNL